MTGRPLCAGVAVLLCVAGANAAPPSIAAPARIAGDGVTAVDLIIELTSADRAKDLSQLAVTTSAGTIGTVQTLDAGRIRAVFVPPRLAENL